MKTDDVGMVKSAEDKRWRQTLERFGATKWLTGAQQKPRTQRRRNDKTGAHRRRVSDLIRPRRRKIVAIGFLACEMFIRCLSPRQSSVWDNWSSFDENPKDYQSSIIKQGKKREKCQQAGNIVRGDCSEVQPDEIKWSLLQAKFRSIQQSSNHQPSLLPPALRVRWGGCEILTQPSWDEGGLQPAQGRKCITGPHRKTNHHLNTSHIHRHTNNSAPVKHSEIEKDHFKGCSLRSGPRPPPWGPPGGFGFVSERKHLSVWFNQTVQSWCQVGEIQ